MTEVSDSGKDARLYALKDAVIDLYYLYLAALDQSSLGVADANRVRRKINELHILFHPDGNH